MIKNYYKIEKQNTPWVVSWRRAKSRCEQITNPSYKYYGEKGIIFLLTKKQIKKLWFRDKAYNMKQPSLDRKNKKKNYIFSNCQFLEHAENSIKDQRWKISQFSLENKFIKTWPSLRDVERKLGIAHSSISCVLKGTRKTAGGFKWKKEI